jgi:hypothetical protein
MNQRERITQLLEEKPHYRQRKNRYLLAAEITGVPAEDCKWVASVLDEFRHQTKVDEVGAKLEQEWKRSPSLASHETEMDRLFNALTF